MHHHLFIVYTQEWLLVIFLFSYIYFNFSLSMFYFSFNLPQFSNYNIVRNWKKILTKYYKRSELIKIRVRYKEFIFQV